MDDSSENCEALIILHTESLVARVVRSLGIHQALVFHYLSEGLVLQRSLAAWNDIDDVG